MASPAPERISQRSRLPYNYTTVPNSLVENQLMFTPAELRFALMALQWAAGRTITDEVWEQTTGLDPRMKQMAIKGLREKGLHVTGEGKRAKYKFEVHAWEAWYKSRPARERARTMGRAKTVSAKPGMQVHPDCSVRCQRLCEPKNEVIPFPATPVAKPVSQVPPENPPEKPSPPPKEFPLSLKAVQSYFPHVEGEFIEKLRLACIMKGAKLFSDAQLAEAIRAAHKSSQKFEGLFITTVPARLAVILEAARSEQIARGTDPQTEESLAREILRGALDPVTGQRWDEKSHEWARKILART
jgi:hypothetical protein